MNISINFWTIRCWTYQKDEPWYPLYHTVETLLIRCMKIYAFQSVHICKWRRKNKQRESDWIEKVWEYHSNCCTTLENNNKNNNSTNSFGCRCCLSFDLFVRFTYRAFRIHGVQYKKSTKQINRLPEVEILFFVYWFNTCKWMLQIGFFCILWFLYLIFQCYWFVNKKCERGKNERNKKKMKENFSCCLFTFFRPFAIIRHFPLWYRFTRKEINWITIILINSLLA